VKELLRLAWPLALAQAALIALGLEDVAIIGHSSVADLAGAALARTIGFACGTLTTGAALSLEPLASQALGAREPRRACAALDATARAVLVTWPVGMACAFGLVELLPWTGVEPDVVSRARMYMLGQTPGFYFYGLYMAHRTFLQAHGVTRPPLVAVAIANPLNVIVCSLLVRGDDALRAVHLPAIGLPALGALGAGLASSVALATIFVVVRTSSARVRIPTEGERFSVREVLRLGVPVGAQMLAEIAVFSLAAIIAGRLGKVVVSAHQIAISLASLTYMAALGTSGATAVLVGRAVGAGESPRRIGLLGIAAGGAMMTAPALAFAIAPRALASLFTDDADVIERSAVLLRIAGAFQLFDGVQAVAGGALRGAADVRFAFLVNVFAYWVIGLPVALVLCFPLHGGAPGLWWGLTIGLVVAAGVLARRFAVLASRPIARV
jgi:MATE family multidrug resistance protein